MMNRRGKSDSAIVAERPTNKAGATSRGAGGAKGGDRGKCGTAKHAPGSEPGKRVPGAGSHTTSSKTEKEGKVHRAPTPHHHISPEHLEAAFFELKQIAAPGVDGCRRED